MSVLIEVKKPNLDFLTTNKRENETNNFSLPIILKNSGHFNWEANSYITKFGGGANTYNIAPLSLTVLNRSYSLNLFCNFLEERNINLKQINDSNLYQYVEQLKLRNVTDETIIDHVRVALGYIKHLSDEYPDWKLSTDKSDNSFGVHIQTINIKSGRRSIEYFDHRCTSGLIKIKSEPEYINDDEYANWLDAINCTTFHPKPTNFILCRWNAIATILEVTGARISEVHKITRTMIKNAAKSLLNERNLHYIRDIPINKGKYKGQKRQVPITKEDLQIILYYIKLIEKKFPSIKHDAIFVDARNGKALKSSYLKNYAKKVINNSPYKETLKHITNHSFRHRLITLNIAKSIRKLARQGTITNYLSIASTACRKLTMHASNETLSHYIHIACELNNKEDSEYKGIEGISTQIRFKIQKMLKAYEDIKSKKSNKEDATETIFGILSELNELGFN
jgi:integrase